MPALTDFPRTKIFLALGVFAALLLGAAPALAQSGKTYFQINLGRSNSDRSGSMDTYWQTLGSSQGTPSSTSASESSDSAWKFQLGGYKNENVAIEGGMVQFGRASYSASYAKGEAGRTVDATGYNLGMVGLIPFSSGFAPLVKFGGAYFQVQEQLNLPGSTLTNKKTADLFTYYYGFGLSWDFSPNLFFAAEGLTFADIGVDSTSKSNVRLITFGAGFRF